MAYTPSSTSKKRSKFLRKNKKSCNFAADYLSTTMMKCFSIVVLSELQPTQNEHVWTFEELNTNVRFTFELIPAQNGEVYYRCKGDAEDLRSVMLQSFKIFK